MSEVYFIGADGRPRRYLGVDASGEPHVELLDEAKPGRRLNWGFLLGLAFCALAYAGFGCWAAFAWGRG